MEGSVHVPWLRAAYEPSGVSGSFSSHTSALSSLAFHFGDVAKLFSFPRGTEQECLPWTGESGPTPV